MTFAMFDAFTGGNQLWPASGTVVKVVNIVNGLYSVPLGTGNGDDIVFTAAMFNGLTPWLEVKVGAETLPRTEITNVPFALISNDLSAAGWENPGEIGKTTPNTGKFTSVETENVKITIGAEDGKVLTSDATGNASWTTPYTGLTNFTESNFTFDSRAGVKFIATNAATNVDLVLQPKGTGAILAHQPDGTPSGGNSRGSGALDLQMDRDFATQVASGNTATVLGGKNNTASGDYSTAMGFESTAPSAYETVFGLINTNYTPSASTSWVATDRLFVVGNGNPMLGTRSNALTILKNANTTIGGSLTVNGNGTNTSVSFPTTRGTSGQVLASDGSGNTSWVTPYPGLTNFTESNYTYNSKYGVKFTPNSAQTNVDFVIQPKGTGAIVAQQPDGTTAGGNNRGANSIDLQTIRSDAAQVASGDYSTIIGGRNNTASGNYSTVIGIGCTANGLVSTAIGNGALSSGSPSISLGLNTNASANASTAMGSQTTASGYSSTSMGYNTIASGDASTTMGWNTTASGSYSIATGYYSNAGGEYSTAMGTRTNAPSAFETVLGRFNTDYTPLDAYNWNSNDRLFVIGNGTASASKSNAFTILKNANTTIGGSLTINGNGTDASVAFPTGRGTNGQVLTSDGSGNTSWATPYSGLTNFTESNYTYDSKTGVKFTPNNAESDVDFVIQPKGTGAILAQQPDGTTASGNSRGLRAVDLQTKRIDASQVASGDYSTLSGGRLNTASGNYSAIGGGQSNETSAIYSSVAGGSTNKASEQYSTISGGQSNESSGYFSTVSGGSFNKASADYTSVAGGYHNIASGYFAFIGAGQDNNAIGYHSFAGGKNNTAQSYGEIVLGVNATVGSGNSSTFVATDRLFVIGNGATSDSKTNALTILKNANTTIGGSLTINGNGTDASVAFPTGRGTSGQVLSTNGSGGTSWSTPYSGLTNFTESNYTYDLKTGVKLLATNAATHADLVLSPKGLGAILAQQPDGTETGGDKRGYNAVDLQMYRENSTQVASGDYSFIGGGAYNTASGNTSTAIGYQNTASGWYSIAMGTFTTASALQSTAIGFGSIASGDYSTAMGGSIASGKNSTAMGFGNTAPSAFETVLGIFSTNYTPSSTTGWNATDRLFVVGNGTADGSRSNALTINKNANTTIGGSLTVNGNGTNTSISFPTGRGTSGQILSTDGSGGTSWATPNAGTVTNVSGTSPISVATGTSTPVISIAEATTSTAGSMSAADKTKLDGIPTLSIGQSYQGGIIFWLDDTGQHGLIAATADQSTEIQWFNGTFTVTNAVRDGIGAGKFNTERIIANQGAGAYAAQICANYQGGNYGDWYLPSKYELNLLYLQKAAVSGFADYWYWSSSEYSSYHAWGQSFYHGYQTFVDKPTNFRVRAVRAF